MNPYPQFNSRHAKKQYWKHRRWHPDQKTEWPWIIFLTMGVVLIFLLSLCGCAQWQSGRAVVSPKDYANAFDFYGDRTDRQMPPSTWPTLYASDCPLRSPKDQANQPTQAWHWSWHRVPTYWQDDCGP